MHVAIFFFATIKRRNYFSIGMFSRCKSFSICRQISDQPVNIHASQKACWSTKIQKKYQTDYYTSKQKHRMRYITCFEQLQNVLLKHVDTNL